MHQAKVVEVDVGVRLALLLVHGVTAGDFVLAQSVGTAWVGLHLLVDARNVLLVDPEGVDAVVEGVLSRI